MISLYIKEAVSKNVCHPTAGEEKKFTTSKILRTSLSREGDSEIGLILYCGIADQHGMSIDDIRSGALIESEEAHFKINKYKEMLASDDRFKHKVRLVNNYLRLKYEL